MSDFSLFDKIKPIDENSQLGRDEPLATASEHFVLGQPIKPPFADHLSQAIFAFGCFWGAERKMWKLEGIVTTAVGYIAGSVHNPTYKEVCSGFSGHTEAVLVVFDPSIVSYSQLLKVFWESHDPTQGMRQGNDVGSQYRSGLYTFSEEQQSQAQVSRESYQQALISAGIVDTVTTEILPTSEFYYAEEYHQQYLAKNPDGYCGIKGTGVSCAI